MFQKQKEFFCFQAEKCMDRKKVNPYVLEYILGFLPFLICLEVSVIIVAVLFVLGLFGIFTGDQIHYILLSVISPVLILLFLFVSLEGCLSGIIPGIIAEHQRQDRRNVIVFDMKNATTMGICQRYFFHEDYLIDHFFPEEWKVVPVNLYCCDLKNDVQHEDIEKKRPFHFYEKKKNYFIPPNDVAVRMFMTYQKSDLLDHLIALEPAAAFEITYLKYSRQLQKIAPIPGWEYADGVAELCEEISNMYP